MLLQTFHYKKISLEPRILVRLAIILVRSTILFSQCTSQRKNILQYHLQQQHNPYADSIRSPLLAAAL